MFNPKPVPVRSFEYAGNILSEAAWIGATPYFTYNAIGQWLGYSNRTNTPEYHILRIIKRNPHIAQFRGSQPNQGGSRLDPPCLTVTNRQDCKTEHENCETVEGTQPPPSIELDLMARDGKVYQTRVWSPDALILICNASGNATHKHLIAAVLIAGASHSGRLTPPLSLPFDRQDIIPRIATIATFPKNSKKRRNAIVTTARQSTKSIASVYRMVNQYQKTGDLANNQSIAAKKRAELKCAGGYTEIITLLNGGMTKTEVLEHLNTSLPRVNRAIDWHLRKGGHIVIHRRKRWHKRPTSEAL